MFGVCMWWMVKGWGICKVGIGEVVCGGDMLAVLRCCAVGMI